MDKPRILIVEDDLDLAEMLNAYFRVQNYDVLTAAWGEEALKLTQDHVIDLVVLDIRLPDIDGYEVCRRLRSQRRTQDTPIIFLTERRDRVDKLQGLELGVVDYITKPFDIQELRLRVRNAINRASRHTLVNAVTDLPEGPTVDEKLATLLHEQIPWTILRISISSLGEFREMYGFVAADDVLRAVTLMIRNAVREHGGPNDYIAHLDTEAFIIITTQAHVEEIRQRIENRIEQSREYFYPLKDREKAREAMQANHLRIQSGIVNSGDTSAGSAFTDLAALKAAIVAATVPLLALAPAQEAESTDTAPPTPAPTQEAESTDAAPPTPAPTQDTASADAAPPTDPTPVDAPPTEP